jgi:hypothetical protein
VRRLALSAGTLGLVLALCVLAAPPRADAMLIPPPVASPDEAVRLAVESMGQRYAGVCEAARSPGDFGALCSRFVATHGDVRAYLLGHTFSEFDTWLFIERGPNGWRFLRTESLGLSGSLSDVPWPCECSAPVASVASSVAL